jgi:hypothetical protein
MLYTARCSSVVIWPSAILAARWTRKLDRSASTDAGLAATDSNALLASEKSADPKKDFTVREPATVQSRFMKGVPVNPRFATTPSVSIRKVTGDFVTNVGGHRGNQRTLSCSFLHGGLDSFDKIGKLGWRTLCLCHNRIYSSLCARSLDLEARRDAAPDDWRAARERIKVSSGSSTIQRFSRFHRQVSTRETDHQRGRPSARNVACGGLTTARDCLVWALAAQVQPKSGNYSFLHCRIPRALNCRSGALVPQIRVAGTDWLVRSGAVPFTARLFHD